MPMEQVIPAVVYSSTKVNKVIADLSVTPIGHGETSVGRYIAAAVAAIEKVEGLRYELTPMGLVMEADTLDPILQAVKVAHEAQISKGIKRIESNLRIDDRRDKPRTMKDKVDAIRRYMKEV